MKSIRQIMRERRIERQKLEQEKKQKLFEVWAIKLYELNNIRVNKQTQTFYKENGISESTIDNKTLIESFEHFYNYMIEIENLIL